MIVISTALLPAPEHQRRCLMLQESDTISTSQAAEILKLPYETNMKKTNWVCGKRIVAILAAVVIGLGSTSSVKVTATESTRKQLEDAKEKKKQSQNGLDNTKDDIAEMNEEKSSLQNQLSSLFRIQTPQGLQVLHLHEIPVRHGFHLHHVRRGSLLDEVHRLFHLHCDHPCCHEGLSFRHFPLVFLHEGHYRVEFYSRLNCSNK